MDSCWLFWITIAWMYWGPVQRVPVYRISAVWYNRQLICGFSDSSSRLLRRLILTRHAGVQDEYVSLLRYRADVTSETLNTVIVHITSSPMVSPQAQTRMYEAPKDLWMKCRLSFVTGRRGVPLALSYRTSFLVGCW